MKDLISTTKYIISLWDKDMTREDFAQSSIRYATFLERTIQKSDCVPCELVDGAYVVLQKPKQFSDYLLTNEEYGKLKRVHCNEWREACERYKQELSKVTFEGFEYKHGLIRYKDNAIDDECFGLTKIEDFLSWNLTLTKPF